MCLGDNAFYVLLKSRITSQKLNIMKGLLKRITLAVLIGLGSLVTVQASGGYNVTVSEGNVVLIKFDDIQSEVAYVELVDVMGEQLWSEVVRGATTFNKQFNLVQLPDGLYKIIMTDGDLIHTQEIKKEINKVYVVNSSTVTILKPEVELKNKNLTVAYPAGSSKLISVSFASENGDLFFSDRVSYEDKFKKLYNLKQLERGDYKVIIKTDQDTYHKSLFVK